MSEGEPADGETPRSPRDAIDRTVQRIMENSKGLDRNEVRERVRENVVRRER